MDWFLLILFLYDAARTLGEKQQRTMGHYFLLSRTRQKKNRLREKNNPR